MSGYVKQHLPIILVNHLTLEKDVRKALSLGFTEVDKSLGNSRIDCEFSGSTAVVSYLKVRCRDEARPSALAAACVSRPSPPGPRTPVTAIRLPAVESLLPCRPLA